MKKYFIALLFGMSLMSMQTASAASLSLTNIFDGSVSVASGTTVSGTADGSELQIFGFPTGLSVSVWKLDVLGNGENITFSLGGGIDALSSLYNNSQFTPPKVGSFSGLDASLTQFLDVGTYYLRIFTVFNGAPTPYSLDITANNPVGNIPVPAAVWLFGSALLGLVGIGRRKSQPALAA